MQCKQYSIMKLTAKEEEIMSFFWDKGPLFVRELLSCYDNPRPHFNTLSTIVRGLEEKGFLDHKAFGNSHQYFPVISREDFNAWQDAKLDAEFAEIMGRHGRTIKALADR